MAGEFSLNYAGSLTPYVFLRRASDGYIWDGSGFVVYAVDDMADYDISLTNKGGGLWTANMPTGQDSGTYLAQYREYASGTTPATTDYTFRTDRFYWTGSDVTNESAAASTGTDPAIEPVTLADVKRELNLDTTSFSTSTTSDTSITIATRSAGTVNGTASTVEGYKALALLQVGTVDATGTLNVKLQDSDDGETWADVTSGAFTEVTPSSDNAEFEKEYTGLKTYLRAVGVVANADAEYSVSIIKYAHTGDEDTKLNLMITSARQHAEEYLVRALINRTKYQYLTAWPGGDNILIDYPPLQSITSIKYKGADGTEYTLAASSYIVETGKTPGRVVLAYGYSWPTTILYPSLPICITYVCGYGTATTDIPSEIRQGILYDVRGMYEFANPDSQYGPEAIRQFRNAVVHPCYAHYRDIRW